MQLGETLRAAYHVLVDLTVIATFFSIRVHFCQRFKFGQRISGTAGYSITLLPIVLSTVPPPGIASVWAFELNVVGGALLLALAAWPIFARSLRTGQIGEVQAR